jgi:gamma-glutamylputrescine oxidase
MALRNYYEATRAVALETRRLDGDLRADVAIIGGGITGCSAALHLAERGYAVALLEAEEIGWGASGRNGGQVLPGLAAGQLKLKRLVGADAAKRIWDMSMEAIDLLHEQIRRFGIPCDPVRGYLHAAVKDRHVRELEETRAELGALGYPDTRVIAGAELRTRLASPRYKAALWDPVAGHIHPLNYTLGIARAAQEAGAALHTGTRVTGVVQHRGRGVEIATTGGRVTADFLILAGGAYLGGIMKPIEGYVMPVGTYIVATEPRADIATLIPGNEAVADLNFVLDYFRRSTDGRMLFGGRVSYSTLPPPNLPAAMLARACRVFPQLADARVEYCWGGNVDITVNRAPHFGRIGENILFLQGFSGHGVALTGLAGKLAAAAVAGKAERFDTFAAIPHRRFPGGRHLRLPALLLATTYFRLRDML